MYHSGYNRICFLKYGFCLPFRSCTISLLVIMKSSAGIRTMEDTKHSETVQKHEKRKPDGDWKGWGDYIEVKRNKLLNQFAGGKQAATENKSSLFQGISIYVNGFTEPSADVLKRLIHQHGGEYRTYLSSRTTHVIAINLPQSKIAKLKPTDKIVRPQWITESIEANRLLPDADYQLYAKDIKNITDYVSSDAVESSSVAVKRLTVPDAKDPNFIRDYYAQSRLHMISTWGQEMKEFVKILNNSNDGSFVGRKKLQDYLARNCKNEAAAGNDEEFRDKTVFMHLDMDCFFVSVGLRDRPSLKGLPVVVTHSKGKSSEFSSSSEIASCSYEARKAGVKNGSWLGDARKLCPNIKTIPYDFEKYKAVSRELYQIVASYTLDIEAVSCDELYVDLTELCRSTGATPLEVASMIREEIFSKTLCNASAGLGPNMLIARLATRKAKPNGQFYVKDCNAADFMKTQKINDLPGVGRSTSEKLDRLKIYTCYDLTAVPLNVIQKEFGPKTGLHMFNFARGIDDRKIKLAKDVVRKSVSCDVNYGIRFEQFKELEIFLTGLSKEVSRRLNEIEMKGKTICLKCMVRSEGAPLDTVKFMGHGIVDAVSKSATLQLATSEEEIISKQSLALFKQMNLHIPDLRGIGISVTKLETNLAKDQNVQGGLMKFVKKAAELTTVSSLNNDSVNLFTRRTFKSKFLKTFPFLFSFGKEIAYSSTISEQNEIKASSKLLEKVSDCPITLKKNADATTLERKSKEQEIVSEEDENSSNVTLTIEEPQFCGLTEYEDVKDLIEKWIKSCDEPLESDCTALSDYFVDLINYSKMEKAYRLILTFFRILQKLRQSDVWLNAYNKIVDVVQSVVKLKYLFPLSLPSSFDSTKNIDTKLRT